MENMNQPQSGYESRHYDFPTKRYIQNLSLRDDPEMIAEYRHLHGKGIVWDEILKGIRSVGILEMELFIYGTNVCMIVETPVNFDWKTAMDKLATLPKQQEWEDVVSLMQGAKEGESSAEKWHLMERFFYLYQ